MKKSIVLLTVGVLMALTSCNLAPVNENAQNLTRDVVLTGDPAVDASIPFLPESDLVRLGLLKSAGFQTEAVSSYSVTFYGPLNDRRAVSGKKLAITLYVNGGASNAVYTLYSGYASTALTNSVVMDKNTNNGNIFKVLTIPSTATGKLYFKIADNQGNTFLDYGSQPYQVKIYSKILSFGFARPYSDPSFAGYLTVNYSGPVTGAGTGLHFGFNGWKNVSDTNMTWYTNSSYYSVADYSSVTLNLAPTQTNFDFCFKNGSVWDNNGGSDWHITLKPIVVVQVSSYNASNKWVNIMYANGGLNAPIYAHYGTDGWQNVQDVQLYTETYQGSWLGYYDKSIQVASSVKTLNACFRDTNGHWENNNGQNWNTDVEY